MATFEDVIEFAARQLDERGLLLDRQLAQSTEGDDALVRLARERLITAGVAVDQYGIGLGRVGRSGVCVDALKDGRLNPPAEILKQSPDNDDGIEYESTNSAADWWVMTNGNIRGPWTIERLIVMRTRNQLSTSDLLRCGPRGAWINQQEVAEIRDAVPPVVPIDEPSTDVNTSSPSHDDLSSSGAGFPAPDSLANSNIPSGEDANPPARPTWLLSAQQRSNARINPADEQFPAAHASSTASPSELLITDKTGVSDQSNSAERTSSRSSRMGSQSVATKADLALRKLDWRHWTIDSVTTTLSSAIPAAFVRTFSARGRTIRRRILIGILATSCVVWGWWYWPPSSRAIFNEIDAVHRRVEELKQGRKSEVQIISLMTEDRARIQRLADIVEQRATDKPSIHRELLFASKRALLAIIDHPRNSSEFEKMYARHMKQAKALLEGRTIEDSTPEPPNVLVPNPTSPLPSATPESKDTESRTP